jgi:hypothetical protein
MLDNNPILVTGAAGNIGSVGRRIVKILRDKDIPIRALVHRLDDRSQLLTDTIRLPFGSARTSPISAIDVARVVATILSKVIRSGF